jgi:hypothetical protein
MRSSKQLAGQIVSDALKLTFPIQQERFLNANETPFVIEIEGCLRKLHQNVAPDLEAQW